MLRTVEAYLERLPHGVDSYPGAHTKSGVVRAAIPAARLLPAVPAAEVPARVFELIANPPMVMTWVRAVHFSAAMCAAFERCFQESGGMPAFDQWILDANRKLLQSPLYRILFLVTVPDRVFIGIERRWGAFHRGSELRVVDRTEKSARLELSFPGHLFPVYVLRAFGAAFQAAAEAVGYRDVKVDLLADAPTVALYTVTWA
jgi:hypothetical protein